MIALVPIIDSTVRTSDFSQTFHKIWWQEKEVYEINQTFQLFYNEIIQ